MISVQGKLPSAFILLRGNVGNIDMNSMKDRILKIADRAFCRFLRRSVGTGEIHGYCTETVIFKNYLHAYITKLEEDERDVRYILARKKTEIDFDDGVKRNRPLFGWVLKKVAGLS